MTKQKKLRHLEYYDLQECFDDLYAKSKQGEVFTKLMDLISSEENMRLAYRNIKRNTGSHTSGTDNLNIEDIEKLSVEKLTEIIQRKFRYYKPNSVRRVEIPKAWDDAREFLDSKRNDSGLLSEEDSKTYDAMEQQIVAYGKEIDRLERQEKLAREMNAATTKPLVSAPGAHTEQTEKTGTASDSYSKAFWNSIRNRNWIDVRNDLQIGTDSEGGYLCPDEFVRL